MGDSKTFGIPEANGLTTTADVYVIIACISPDMGNLIEHAASVLTCRSYMCVMDGHCDGPCTVHVLD